MTNLKSFAFVAVIVLTSSVGFGQTDYTGDALANQMRSQAYSRLSNMGVEMPPMPQHSTDFRKWDRAIDLPAMPAQDSGLAIEPKPERTSVSFWNPLTWFSSASPEENTTQVSPQNFRSTTATAHAFTDSNSVSGSSRVSASGTGGQALAISNVNGQISIEASFTIDGKARRIQLQGKRTRNR